MKKYKIQFNGFKKPFEINLPILSLKPRKTNLILNIIDYLFLSLVPLFLVLLPLVTLLNNGVSLELNLLNYLILSTSIFLIIFITRLVLLGFKVLMDPPTFVNLLFFALLTTTASVVVTSPSPLNTFGSGNFRALAGLTIMVLLTSFYILNSYLNSAYRLRKFIKSLILGFFIYLIGVIINPSFVSVGFTLMFITIFSIFYIFWSLNSNKLKLLKLSLYVVLVSIALIRLSTLSTFITEIYVILFTLLFVSVITVILLIIFRRDLLKISLLKFKNTLNLFKDKKYRTLFRNLFIQLLIVSPIIILLLLILLTIQKQGTFLVFNIIVERLVNTFKGFFEVANGNFLNILSGFGFSGFRASYPLISNIFYIQGILGLIAYISLGVYLLFKSISLVKNNIKDYRLALGIFISLLFVTIYSLISYVGLLTIVFSWMLILILSYLLRTKDLLEVKNVVKPLVVRGKLNNIYGVILKLIVLVILIGLIVFGSVSFINAIKLY